MAPSARAIPASSTATRRYEPSTATEAVLVRLDLALRAGTHAAVLRGAPGSGKPLLLGVLAERLGDAFRCVGVPAAGLAPEELCRGTLAALDEPPYPSPRRALRARIARDAVAGAPPLLLMVDDAGGMPVETRRLLVAIQAEAGGALRALWVDSPGFRRDEVEAGGVDVLDVELELGA